MTLAYLSRRDFHRSALGAILASPFALPWAEAKPASRIESIDYKGVLVGECTLPGETRKDDVVPAHPNGLQVARDRWMVLYATRGFRGVDDDRSIVYQLRKDGFDGPVLKEGMLAQARVYDPFPDKKQALPEGKVYFKQHGHPVIFGVAKGAESRGKPLPHANLFVAKWRRVARLLDEKTNTLVHGSAEANLGERTQAVEWVQFRLNERNDDIEIVQPAAVLRQQGFERGAAFCSAENVHFMNQSFTPPVPFNHDASEWADCNHFDGGRIAALKYRFNAQLGRYEWVALGPLAGDAKSGLFEASLARLETGWAISARQASRSGVAWLRTADPFAQLPAPVQPKEPACNAPLTAFTCADGVLRLFTGDGTVSPQHNVRDPLYCWDVDPDKQFAGTNRRIIFASVQAKLPIRPAAVPKLDMCKLLPAQGNSQLVVWRVSVRSYNQPYVGGSGKPTGIPAINADEKAVCAIHYARIHYRDGKP